MTTAPENPTTPSSSLDDDAAQQMAAITHVASALYLEHFVVAHGSRTSAERLVATRPFDPDGPAGQDFLREAVAAINAWEQVRPR